MPASSRDSAAVTGDAGPPEPPRDWEEIRSHHRGRPLARDGLAVFGRAQYARAPLTPRQPGASGTYSDVLRQRLDFSLSACNHFELLNRGSQLFLLGGMLLRRVMQGTEGFRLDVQPVQEQLLSLLELSQ